MIKNGENDHASYNSQILNIFFYLKKNYFVQVKLDSDFQLILNNSQS